MLKSCQHQLYERKVELISAAEIALDDDEGLNIMLHFIDI